MKPGDANENRVLLIAGFSRHSAMVSSSKMRRYCLIQTEVLPRPALILPSMRSGSIMNRMGFSETIFLFLLALLIFGPKKLPEIARQVGKALNEFKRASNEFKSQLASEISQLEMESQRQILPPTEPPAGSVAKLPEPVPPIETTVEPHSEMKVAPDA